MISDSLFKTSYCNYCATWFNIKNLCTLPAECIYEVHMIVRVESSNLPEQCLLIFVMGVWCAYSAVETEFLNIILVNFRPQMVNLTIPSTCAIFIVFEVMWL
jgi:hypothetical protein